MREILVALSLIILASITAPAQTRTFTRNDLEYQLDLPSASWRAVTRVDVHQHFEFVNGDNVSNGYLRLRKKFVAAGTTAEDLFRYDEKWELQNLPGYVVGSDGSGTAVAGYLKGKAFSYEYTNQGTRMDGRIYYLQVYSRTFYALHFTVASDKLRGFREQMDLIAGSFRLK